MIDPTIQYTIAGAFALLFAWSGVEKLRNIEKTISQLADYELIPAPLTELSARLSGLLEATAATLLITQYIVHGAQVGIALLLIYGLAIGINLLRGRTHIDCGCQMRSSNGISWWLVSRNMLMACLLAVVTLPGSGRTLIWIDYLVIILAVIAAALIYLAGNLLISHYHDQRTWWTQ